MSATGAEEIPFIAGMDHEPPKHEDWHEVTVTLDRVGKKAWRLDGMLTRVMDIAGHALGKVRTLADRGPDPDYAETPYARGLRDGAKFAGSPNVGGVNGNSKVLTALVALNTALLIGIGAWLLNTVSRHDRELAVIACQLNPQQCLQVSRGQR